MKKFMMLMIAILLVSQLFAGTAFAADAQGLTDIGNHWAKDTILDLIDRGIVDGYADGAFRPDHPINRDEFIKLVVTALGIELENGKGYWAQPYIDQALELGLIYPKEFSAYNVPIRREEMASIIVKAADRKETAPTSIYDQVLSKTIPDYSQISPKYRTIVEKSYKYGLITGMADYTFEPKDTSTRAEAATVISRLLNPEFRKPFGELVENELALQTGWIEDITNPYIAYPFFEKYKDRKDMQGFGSAEELFRTVKMVRAKAAEIQVVVDEKNRKFTVTIPEYDKKVMHFYLRTMVGEYRDPGTYTIRFDDMWEETGFFFDILIDDQGDHGGSWVLYEKIAYLKDGKIIIGEGSKANNDVFTANRK